VLLLRELLGAENLIMGSDWPHAEGLPQPTDYLRELEGFEKSEIEAVMRGNALALSRRRPV
jgi:predicted TIM-barrel fold metal-dependent hydrolase